MSHYYKSMPSCQCVLASGKRAGKLCGKESKLQIPVGGDISVPVCRRHKNCVDYELPDTGPCLLLDNAFNGLPRLQKVRSYEVDMDGGPTKWNDMLDDFRDEMKQTVTYLHERLGSGTIRKILRGMASMLNYSTLVLYHNEMRAIAKHMDMSLGDIMLLNFTYESAAHCTSVVTTAITGYVIHGRTLDWSALFLRKLSCRVVMTRGGSPVYETSTWAGFVGVFTGVRRGVFSVSVNYRDTGSSMLWNLLQVVTGAWSVGLLVRHLLEDDTLGTGTKMQDYWHVRDTLANTRLIAPVYFTVAFPHNGIILTRGRNSVDDEDRLHEPIAQANMDRNILDPNLDFTDSLSRRFTAEKLGGRVSPTKMARMLNTSPVRHETTIYETIMYPSACEGEAALVMGVAK